MKKIIISFVVLICAFVSLLGYSSWQVYWRQPAADAQAIQVEVKAGESVAELSADLVDKKIISGTRLFKWYLTSNNLDKKIPAGYFSVKPGSSIRTLANALTDAKSSSAKVLFKEGETIRDYGALLENNGLMSADDFQKVAGYSGVNYGLRTDLIKPKDYSGEFNFLSGKPKNIGLEGYLFPDTYFFRKDVTADQIIQKMLDNFNEKLTPELRAEIERQGKTIHQIITMASLIEAEARTDDDRRMVSDVLWRRLGIGMGLQLDSTVNYLTNGNKPSISSEEQEINSLYNTYKFRDLPPGPIDNPGMSAILAAIYPEKNEYWFFLADKTGRVHFAENLDKHNELKYKYLKSGI